MSGKESPERREKARSETRERKAVLSVRVTPDERATITEKAEAAGLSTGGFLRACALRRVTAGTKRRAPVDRDVLERTIAELRRVGNNINQLAKAANMNHPTNPAILRHALNEFTETLQQLREAREA
jgi:uncharacterized protein (DUF1778 family)